jgi:putative CocE/NonD family hydrolase
MRKTRLVRWLAAGALLAAGVPGAVFGAAHADSAGYTLHQDVQIPMSDGEVISANVFLPDRGCPCPTILNQNPYRKSTTPNGFVQHGYAEVVTDVRGTGSSGGYWNVFGAREQKDGAEIVHWITGQRWSDGTIGTWGASYMAINQFMTAEQPGTSAIKAMFPIVPMSDSYRDVTWSGGAWDSSFMSWWYALTTAESVEPPDYAQSDPQLALNTESQHLLDAAQFQAPVLAGNLLGSYQHALCQATSNSGPTCNYVDGAYDSADQRLRSPIDRVARVHVPTFVVGGSWDIFQRGEPVLYNALDLPSTQKKLLIGPWYHVAASAGGNAGDLPAVDTSGHKIPSVHDLALAWFDHWLKHKNNGIEKTPNVETYMLGKNKWVQSPSFPMAGTTYQNWYLTPDAAGSGANSLNDGSLASAPAKAATQLLLPWLPANDACSRQTFQWSAGLNQAASASPTYCESNNNQNETQALTFTTKAMPKAYTLSGPMNLHLFTSSRASDTSLTAVVTDVAPDGTSDIITGGSLVASQRKVTTTRCGRRVEFCSVYKDGQIVQPWHPFTYDASTPLHPNEIYDLQLEIFPTTAQVLPGHRLRVVVMSGDSPHRLDTASTMTGEANGAGLDTLYFGPGYPSRLYVGTAPAS